MDVGYVDVDLDVGRRAPASPPTPASTSRPLLANVISPSALNGTVRIEGRERRAWARGSRAGADVQHERRRRLRRPRPAVRGAAHRHEGRPARHRQDHLGHAGPGQRSDAEDDAAGRRAAQRQLAARRGVVQARCRLRPGGLPATGRTRTRRRRPSQPRPHADRLLERRRPGRRTTRTRSGTRSATNETFGLPAPLGCCGKDNGATKFTMDLFWTQSIRNDMYCRDDDDFCYVSFPGRPGWEFHKSVYLKGHFPRTDAVTFAEQAATNPPTASASYPFTWASGTTMPGPNEAETSAWIARVQPRLTTADGKSTERRTSASTRRAPDAVRPGDPDARGHRPGRSASAAWTRPRQRRVTPVALTAELRQRRDSVRAASTGRSRRS